jgi:K+-sensing histidine kinase KdpD
MTKEAQSVFRPEVLRTALIGSLTKLDPRVQVRNPVMFVVEVGAAITTIGWLIQAFGGEPLGGGDEPAWYTFTVAAWLWLTVIFANLAEALAEGRGKAQAQALRAMRSETIARLAYGGEKPASELTDEAPQALAERVLALITPKPPSQRLVRRAWRSAQRLGAELDLLYVQPPGAPPRGDEREQLEALRRLASVLGAAFIVEEGDDLVATAARVAAERGTTYVLIGRPEPRTGLRRFGESLPDRLLRKLPGVDVRIVADRSRRLEGMR